MSIKQLNATYVPEEDRVLFRLTTHPSDEYRLWLTRARVGELLSLGEHVAIVKLQAEHPPQQAKVIAQFKQQVVQQTTQFTQFEPASRFPLGAEPTLVKALRIEQADANQTLHLDLVGNKTLSLKLNDDLLAKMRMLMQTIADKAQWHLFNQAHEMKTNMSQVSRVQTEQAKAESDDLSDSTDSLKSAKKLLH